MAEGVREALAGASACRGRYCFLGGGSKEALADAGACRGRYCFLGGGSKGHWLVQVHAAVDFISYSGRL